jgi:uncharacterized protein YjbI with pentapeptide repeats
MKIDLTGNWNNVQLTDCNLVGSSCATLQNITLINCNVSSIDRLSMDSTTFKNCKLTVSYTINNMKNCKFENCTFSSTSSTESYSCNTEYLEFNNCKFQKCFIYESYGKMASTKIVYNSCSFISVKPYNINSYLNPNYLKNCNYI